MSESKPTDEASRKRYNLTKPGHSAVLGTSATETCLLVACQALLRGHDFYPGLFAGHGKPLVDDKRKAQV
jgi:hypothetical protein